jgi:hypothetical protein
VLLNVGLLQDEQDLYVHNSVAFLQCLATFKYRPVILVAILALLRHLRDQSSEHNCGIAHCVSKSNYRNL